MIKKKFLLFFIIIYTSSTAINTSLSEINRDIINDINKKINDVYIEILEMEASGLNIDNMVNTINIINDYNTKIQYAINNGNTDEATIYINEVEILMSQINNEAAILKENIGNTDYNQKLLNITISTTTTVIICVLIWTIFKIYYINRIQNMKPMVATK